MERKDSSMTIAKDKMDIYATWKMKNASEILSGIKIRDLLQILTHTGSQNYFWNPFFSVKIDTIY